MSNALTAEKVRSRVDKIKGSNTNRNQKHFLESTLWYDVLSCIASGSYCGNVSEIANEALKTTKIDFARMYGEPLDSDWIKKCLKDQL